MRRLAAAVLALVAAGCAGETWTIRELGHPVFEPVVGPDAELVRAEPSPPGELDAHPPGVDRAGHVSRVRGIPGGDGDTVWIAFRAEARGGVPVGSLAVAAFAVDFAQAQRFQLSGRLPDAEPALAFAHVDEVGPDGVLRLLLRVPRAAIPPGRGYLALPCLVRFRDGWVQLTFQQTPVPPPNPGAWGGEEDGDR